MKFVCKIFLEMGITFRDKSNDSNQLMFGYSDATVPSFNFAVKDLIRFIGISSALVNGQPNLVLES